MTLRSETLEEFRRMLKAIQSFKFSNTVVQGQMLVSPAGDLTKYRLINDVQLSKIWNMISDPLRKLHSRRGNKSSIEVGSKVRKFT